MCATTKYIHSLQVHIVYREGTINEIRKFLEAAQRNIIRTTMKTIVLILVLSIGCINATTSTTEEDELAEDAFSKIGCTVSNAYIENIKLSLADSEYTDVRRAMDALQDKIDAISPAGGLQLHSTTSHTPQDCSQISSSSSGIYTIQPSECPQGFRTFCDMETVGGGWTVIQRRRDGSIGFNRGWKDYQNGFGSKNSEYWIGNENLFWLTAQKRYELRIELTDFNDEVKYATYDRFRVGDKGNRYKLLIGSYVEIESTAGDAFSSHNHAPFTTSDYDNDQATTGNCAGYFLSGWWYTNCFRTNLNGVYRSDGEEQGVRGIVWSEWRGLNISMKAVDMKIRPI